MEWQHSIWKVWKIKKGDSKLQGSKLERMCTPTPSFFTPVTTWRFQTQTDNGDEYFHLIFWIFQIANKVYAYFTLLKRINEEWVQEGRGGNSLVKNYSRNKTPHHWRKYTHSKSQHHLRNLPRNNMPHHIRNSSFSKTRRNSRNQQLTKTIHHFVN
jgi:hypothetical protein